MKLKETDRNRKTSQKKNQMCQMIKVKNRPVCVAGNNNNKKIVTK